MQPLQYALVAYVKNDLGRFVEDLRREVHPELGHLPAHITILPPRILAGPEVEALATLERLCADVQPFEIGLDVVESFQPVTPTVYLRVHRAALRLHELHERLNTAALDFYEQWPYMPHLTIVKLADEGRLPAVMQLSRERWSAYRGPRSARVEELTFVREGERSGHWTDLAPVQLGRALASKSRA
jgi:2'-5' RNA ligase